MDAKVTAAQDPDLAGLERLMMYAFAAFGLPAIAGAVALMSWGMRFLPGW
jgi:hypothetical protein